MLQIPQIDLPAVSIMYVPCKRLFYDDRSKLPRYPAGEKRHAWGDRVRDKLRPLCMLLLRCQMGLCSMHELR